MNKITHDADDAEKEEADRVAANITKLLNEKSFSLTPLEFLNIHRHLFEDIFKHAGVAVGHLDIYSKGGKLRRLYILKNLQGEAKQWLADRDVSSGYIYRICNELETRGSAIPSFHINAFILKATLKAEWTEKDTLARNTDNNVHKDVHKEITERQALIISMIQDNPNIGRIEMSTKLGVNEKTIRRDLEDLKEKRIIVRIGGRKEGHWEILIDNHSNN